MLRPREGVLVLQTLLWPDEVRAPKLEFQDEDVSVRQQELAMAESYISALSGDFDPDEFSDGYRDALEEVISDKVAGREVKAPAEEPQQTGQVVDLMEALRRSVAEAKAKRGEGDDGAGSRTAKKAAGKKAAGGKSPAKKATAKKTAKKTASKSGSAKKAAAKKSATRRSA
jgi:DNA end-binding protein Ku